MLAEKLPLPTDITEAEYLAGEPLATVRHEYVDGKVYAMAGTSRRHNDIAINIIAMLRPLTRNTPCKVNASDVKVRADKSKAYYYPDVVVGCEADDTNPYYLEKPCLIAEITSKSTEWKDYFEKALAYQKIPSLQAYWIISPDQPQVVVFYRDTENDWEVTRYADLEQTVPLPCLEAPLTLADIYAGVDFSQPIDEVTP